MSAQHCHPFPNRMPKQGLPRSGRGFRVSYGSVSCPAPWLLAFTVLVLFFLVVAPVAAQQTDRVRKIGDQVKCMCGGCNDTASSCNHTGGAFSGPCDQARKELAEIARRVASGESDDLVLQDFVQEYGPQVLVVPPARGFNLAAWLMPIAVALAGFALALLIVRRWRAVPALAQPGAPAPAPPRPDLVARARAETEDEDF
jgi:cytochrome c-type biogenesis protein CcmH/NrfF